jgi:hypothetical protein
MGDIKSAKIKHNSTLNNPVGASDIQYNCFNMAGARIA